VSAVVLHLQMFATQSTAVDTGRTSTQSAYEDVSMDGRTLVNDDDDDDVTMTSGTAGALSEERRLYQSPLSS